MGDDLPVSKDLVKPYLADSFPEVKRNSELEWELAEDRAMLDKDLALDPKQAGADVVVTDSAYPYIKYSGTMQFLPGQTRRLYGCHNCEWRGTKMCPFNIERGKGAKKVRHPNGICLMRINYLKNFYRGVKERPTFTEWVNDYNQGVAQLQLQDDWVKLKQVEEKLSEYEHTAFMSDEEKEDRDALQALSSKIRFEWFSLWQELMKFDDKRLDRDAPKKLEVTHTNLSLSDIHKVMSGGVIDAEFSEVKDEDKP